jgi:hypothetical protein
MLRRLEAHPLSTPVYKHNAVQNDVKSIMAPQSWPAARMIMIQWSKMKVDIPNGDHIWSGWNLNNMLSAYFEQLQIIRLWFDVYSEIYPTMRLRYNMQRRFEDFFIKYRTTLPGFNTIDSIIIKENTFDAAWSFAGARQRDFRLPIAVAVALRDV